VERRELQWLTPKMARSVEGKVLTKGLLHGRLHVVNQQVDNVLGEEWPHVTQHTIQKRGMVIFFRSLGNLIPSR